MDFIIRLVVSALAVILSAYILPGVSVKSFWTALWVALILTLLNVFITPIMVFLTIPITIITFGLFLFVINAVVILIASALISGFQVNGFIWALIYSIILTIVSYILEEVTNVELLNI
ncbi:MAG: phage holin family protein [Bacteroidales bacterium]|nr:phage holin family protein [Bacteroidales bacterium]